MLPGLLLPFRFDTVLLKADLALVRAYEWTPHYNQRDYGGEWRGAALRSAGGTPALFAAVPANVRSFADTALMERCCYFRKVVSAFRCPLKSVRLLSLLPGSFIREHTDNALDYEDGEVRIHVPVQTGPDVEFYSAGERLLMEEGRAYYVNVNLPHRVNNRGVSDRIHLVIDAEVNEWVHELFRCGRPIPAALARPRNFDDFRAAVLNDSALQDRLRLLADHEAFFEAILGLGRATGFDFVRADVDAALESARRKAPAVRHSGCELPAGWTPVGVTFREERPVAEWAYLGREPLLEPFFEDSVRRAMRSPFAQLFRCELPLEAFKAPSLAPAGLIFHMSRCGSTLISQMLAALPDAVVISEAPPIDQVIQAHLRIPGLSREKQVTWLRHIVAAMGRPRQGGETRLFIKFDAWHIHNLPLIRAAFPDTPWIFVSRDPAEVMASHLRNPGMHVLPGAMEDPRVLGLTANDITALDREQWCARVIANILESAERYGDEPRGLFVNYGELPGALWERVSHHFGIAFTAEEIERMRERSRLHSKSGVPWTD